MQLVYLMPLASAPRGEMPLKGGWMPLRTSVSQLLRRWFNAKVGAFQALSLYQPWGRVKWLRRRGCWQRRVGRCAVKHETRERCDDWSAPLL